MKELPENVVQQGETDVFDPATLPDALQNWHQTGSGVWAQIRVLAGSARYEILTDPPEVNELTPARPGVIEPEQPHRVTLSADGQMQVVFYREAGE
jgi:tellurite resistance-related uncharacterized protein